MSMRRTSVSVTWISAALAALACLGVFPVGCKSGDDGPPPDTTAPTVTGRSPAPNATGVATTATVTVTFSEDMNQASVEAAGTIVVSNGGQVAGTVTYDGATRTATFTPSANLLSTTVYNVVVTTAAKDLAGNSLPGADSWAFTTSDGTPPEAVGLDPGDGESGVPTNRAVTVLFDEDMDAATIDTSSFTLAETGSGTPVTAQAVSYDSGTRTATFKPSSDLAASTSYTATLAATIQDPSGNALANAPVTWTFETGAAPDTTPPFVQLWAPADSAAGVSIATNQEITFNEGMNRAATQAAISLSPAPTHPLLFHWNPSSTKVTVQFDTEDPAGIAGNDILADDTSYTVTVGATAEDRAGNTFAGASAVTWTTVADTTKPRVQSISPDVSNTLALPLPTLEITFNETMATLAGYVQFESARDRRSPSIGSPDGGVSIAWGAPNRLDVTFSTALLANTEYRVSLSAFDAAGNSLADEDEEFILVTAGSDAGAPTLVSTAPADGETGVPVDSLTFLGFSRPMGADLLDHISVSGNGSTDVRLERVIDPSGVLVSPLQAWPASSTITVSVAATARDASGNTLAAADSYSFTTGAVNANPWGVDPDYSTLKNNDTDLALDFRVWFLFEDGSGNRVFVNQQTLAPQQVTIREQASGIPLKGYFLKADEEELQLRGLFGASILKPNVTYELIFHPTLKNTNGVGITTTTIEFSTASGNARPVIFGPPRVEDVVSTAGGVMVELRASGSDVDLGDSVSVTAQSDVDSGFNVTLSPFTSTEFGYQTAGANEPSITTYSTVQPLTFSYSDGAGGHTFTVKRDIFPWNPAALATPTAPVGGVSVPGGAPSYTFSIPAATRNAAQVIFFRVADATSGETALMSVLPSTATSFQHPADNPLPSGSYVIQVAVLRFSSAAVRGEFTGIGVGVTGASPDFTVP